MRYSIHLIKAPFVLSLIYQEPDMSGSLSSLVYVPKEKRKIPVELTVCKVHHKKSSKTYMYIEIFMRKQVMICYLSCINRLKF